MGVSVPTEVDFDLDNASPASGILRQRCTTAKRSIVKGLEGHAVRHDLCPLAAIRSGTS